MTDSSILIAEYVGIFVILLLVPMIVEMYLNYRTVNYIIRCAASKDQEHFTREELNTCCKMIIATTAGLSNVTRRLVSVAIIAILGIAIFHVLVIGINNDATQSAQITNNILSMLAGTLAAMIGFYFGGRTAEKANEQFNTRTLDDPCKPNTKTSDQTAK